MVQWSLPASCWPQQKVVKREMLAVLCGLEKFHYYAYCQPVVVESDQSCLKLSLHSICQVHHLASLGWCCTFRSTTCKSNMFLERTFLSLTPCQESAHVMMKPYKGLMYLCKRSIFNLIQAQSGFPDKRRNWKRYNLLSPAWNHYAWMAWKEI